MKQAIIAESVIIGNRPQELPGSFLCVFLCLRGFSPDDVNKFQSAKRTFLLVNGGKYIHKNVHFE